MGGPRARFRRFLEPRSIAVYGGSWAKNVIEQLRKSGFDGQIWPVHPNLAQLDGVPCYASTDDLPHAPDAAFIGVNRTSSIDVVSELAELGAGGAICFASGFTEADSDQDSLGSTLQTQLVTAAGKMPLLGPNCYGYLNYLDNVTLWPDQHGGLSVDSGVAIIAQSSNVAINMTMQQRGLPVAYMFTVGNQACVGLNELAEYAIDDPRVSTIGLFVEGFGDLRAFELMAQKAKTSGKNIVALKLGKSTKSQLATMTHTATLAGGAAAGSAFLERLGIVEVDSLSCFIETLALLHVIGPLNGSRLSSISCSGGEASLMADAALGSVLEFPDLSAVQRVNLSAVLGDKVTLANPLDYHTYIWSDVEKMTACFSAVMLGEFDLTVFVLDIPRSDHCEVDGHRCAIEAIINAKQQTSAKVAVIASMPENIDEKITAEFQQAGIGVLHGLKTAIESITAAISAGRYQARVGSYQPVYLPSAINSSPFDNSYSLSEADAKAALATYGLAVPQTLVLHTKGEIKEVSNRLEYPMVLKGLGLAHKSESGAVVLDIQNAVTLHKAVASVPDCPDGYMLEQMIGSAIAELIIGVSRDQTGLLLMTIGAGGVLTELLSDSASVLVPASQYEIEMALSNLKVNNLLQGYRGKPKVDHEALLTAILAIQAYVLDHADQLTELDVNPLIVREHDCYAVDALIRLRFNE